MTETRPITMPRGRAFTVADLEIFADDGNRYELIDGELLVSPVPTIQHQTAMLELAYQLDTTAPPDFQVIFAPFPLRPNENTQVQPDVLVARRADFTEANLPTAPLLAVEVLSPGSAIMDFHLKKALYERLGTPSYWVVDPIDPTLTVFELDQHGQYRLVAEVEGDLAFQATLPFEVRIVPNELLEG